MSRLIIASNRLPVSIQEAEDGLKVTRSNGGLATALSSFLGHDDSLWVGWTGFRRTLSAEELRHLRFPAHLIPISLTNTEVTNYYDKFSNGILWPLAHNLPPALPFEETLWNTARRVTHKFADVIEEAAASDDIIWIHDYHLMLLPGELRRRGLKNRIGFFLHTPWRFPMAAGELPNARLLLESLLSVDVLGFQTKPDTERFISACRALGLSLPSRLRVRAFPIGIDFAAFDSLNDDPKIQRKVAKIQQVYRQKTIIFSLSRLDYTKGILTQLRAYEGLMANLAESSEVIYRLNVAPSREAALEYRELRREIEDTVARINRRFASERWQPIIYTYDNMGLEEIAMWYQIADIHLNLPITDGMNLVVKEYIAARRKPGIPIITSTMGAALQLTDALVIPPENTAAATNALIKAVRMPSSEKRERWNRLRRIVEQYQVSDWAEDFLNTLTK